MRISAHAADMQMVAEGDLVPMVDRGVEAMELYSGEAPCSASFHTAGQCRSVREAWL